MKSPRIAVLYYSATGHTLGVIEHHERSMA
jgi:hypothetical protein